MLKVSWDWIPFVVPVGMQHYGQRSKALLSLRLEQKQQKYVPEKPSPYPAVEIMSVTSKITSCLDIQK